LSSERKGRSNKGPKIFAKKNEKVNGNRKGRDRAYSKAKRPKEQGRPDRGGGPCGIKRANERKGEIEIPSKAKEKRGSKKPDSTF